jgi:hypothetical protein
MKEDKFGFDDFEIDTGVQIDNTDEISDETSETIEESNEEGAVDFGTSTPTQQAKDDIKGVKRTSIYTAIIGFVVIVIALAIGAIALNARARHTEVQNPPASTTEVTQQAEVGSQQEATFDIVENASDNVGNQGVAELASWVEFTQGPENKIDQIADSNFTVTSIQHVAKVVNEKNDMMVKSIIKGNISGLVGTYEVEIPYEKAMYLAIGTVFNIKYHYVIENEVRIIGEIEY